jgi:TatD DNase family protein
MYSDDLPAVLMRAQAAGVGTILAIGIGEGPDEMQRALEIVAEYSGRPATPAIYASAGIHPQEAHRADAGALDKLARLAKDERVIAIGEIGLDYYHVDNPLVRKALPSRAVDGVARRCALHPPPQSGADSGGDGG